MRAVQALRRTRRRAGWPVGSGAIDVSAVIDPHDVDHPSVFVDSVDDAIASASRGMEPGQLAGERLTEPTRVLGDRSDEELPHGSRDTDGKTLGQGVACVAR